MPLFCSVSHNVHNRTHSPRFFLSGPFDTLTVNRFSTCRCQSRDVTFPLTKSKWKKSNHENGAGWITIRIFICVYRVEFIHTNEIWWIDVTKSHESLLKSTQIMCLFQFVCFESFLTWIESIWYFSVEWNRLSTHYATILAAFSSKIE